MLTMKTIIRSSWKAYPTKLPRSIKKDLLYPFFNHFKPKRKIPQADVLPELKKKLNYTLDWHFKAEIEGRNGDREVMHIQKRESAEGRGATL